MVIKLDKVMYTTEMTVTGGRDGRAVSPDGKFDMKMAKPKELGGPGGEGTNPEQLFAAGYAACFLSAMQHVARQQKIGVPSATTIKSTVSIGQSGEALALAVVLDITIPGMDKKAAEELVDAAHHTCPYSNATRDNIEVTLKVSV